MPWQAQCSGLKPSLSLQLTLAYFPSSRYIATVKNPLLMGTCIKDTREVSLASILFVILIPNCRYIPAGNKKRSPAVLVHTVVVNMAFFNQVFGKKLFHKSNVTMAITLRPYTSCILTHSHLMCTGPVEWSQATVVTAIGISMVFFNQPFCNYELSPPEVNVTSIIHVLSLCTYCKICNTETVCLNPVSKLLCTDE